MRKLKRLPTAEFVVPESVYRHVAARITPRSLALFVGLTLIVFIGLVLGASGYRDIGWILTAFAMTGLAVTTVLRLLLVRQLRMRYEGKRSTPGSDMIQLHIGPDGIFGDPREGAPVLTHWEDYQRVKRLKSGYLLWLNSLEFTYVPFDALDDGAREMLEGRLVIVSEKPRLKHVPR
ncbi:MAG: YcxB family protein [Fimbriimonadaceae bacterium]|nr:YcxB family protein [Fimbriimonadaceae bacterium]